jgi:hypothetical protein
MAKSNYPNKLDTSIEIPAVRDNIIEVGSDVLNSLRSAIFQIERTLGINPQGAVGNSVSDRLNKALDGNGNILKEALDRANLVSGPIVDADVSKAAAIDENKLRLNYPTQLLQEEISQLTKQLDSVLATLEELSYLFGAHVHIDATNRHKGIAITIDAIDNTSSSIGVTSLDTTTSQGAFEEIFQSHINYDGSDISTSNRSHRAEQIFFNNTDVSAYIDSEDVQGAIEDVLEQTSGQLDDHQNKSHSNGILRTSKITSADDSTSGQVLLEDIEVLFFQSSTEDSTRISSVSFPGSPDAPPEKINKSDILRITKGGTLETFDYQISMAHYSLDGSTLESVDIFGFLTEGSDTGDVGRIFRNVNNIANAAGLLVTTREYPNDTNADLLQIANPDSSAIISRGIRPSEISLSNRYFTLTVDGEHVVDLDIFDGLSAAGQTIDTIIKSLNTQLSENGISVSAYRVDYDEKQPPEIALVHTVPSDAGSSFTLMVSRGSDDALDSLGFGLFEDVTIDAGLGSSYFIKGSAYNGLAEKMAETGLILMSGTPAVLSSSVDFKSLGIADGDLLAIVNSASDDGTYVITDVSPTTITVDRYQLSGEKWSAEAGDDAIFYVYSNTIFLKAFQFLKASSSTANAAIIDIFMDYNRNLFYDTRIEYGIEAHGASDSLISPCDFKGDVSVYTDDSPGALSASLTSDDNPLLSLDGGPPVELSGVVNSYIELTSGLHNINLLMYIESSDDLFTKIDDDGPFEMLLYGSEETNREENLFLARILFDSGNSRVSGFGADYPRVFKKLETGVTSHKDLSSNAIFVNQQRPLGETRSNGVIHGLELSSGTGQSTNEAIDDNYNYVINIAGGVCYVKGKRFELYSLDNLITDIVSPEGGGTDKFFVAINEWGEVVFSEADSVTCSCSLNPYNYCVLGSIEYDSANPPAAVDLRLFIDNLDLKVLNSITVSPQPGMGHFSSINKALKYAKRFSQMFPKAGVPTIHLKSGIHRNVVDMKIPLAGYTTIDQSYQPRYDDGIWINFPVNIVGEGDSTVLDLVKIFEDLEEGDDDRASSGATDMEDSMIIVGPGVTTTPDGDSDVISSGFVTLKDFRLRLSDVKILDPIINDNADSPINWGVKIENVTFDLSEKEGFGEYNRGVFIKDKHMDVTKGAGNITISGCNFINSLIGASGGLDAEYLKNINILNNIFRDQDIDVAASEYEYALHIDGSGHIFDIYDSPAENNIEFRGNIVANNDPSVNTAYVDASGNHEWGDRVSRNLVAGGSLGVGMSSPENALSNEMMPDGITPREGNALYIKSKKSAFLRISADSNDNNVGENAGIILTQAGGDSRADIRFEGDAGATYANSVISALCINNNLGGDASVQIGTEDSMALTVRDGKVGIGINDPSQLLHVYSAVNDSIIRVEEAQSTDNGPNLRFKKSRADTACWQDDYLGFISFHAHDGDNMSHEAAAIMGRVDSAVSGVIGVDDTPGRLEFYTTPQGSNSEVERMVIKNDGKIGMGTADPDAGLHVDYADGNFLAGQASGAGGGAFCEITAARTGNLLGSPTDFPVLRVKSTQGGALEGANYFEVVDKDDDIIFQIAADAALGNELINFGLDKPVTVNRGPIGGSGHVIFNVTSGSVQHWGDGGQPYGTEYWAQSVFVDEDLAVGGEISATSSTASVKAFRIPHPDPDKESSYDLMHCTVETPTGGDTLYRWSVDVTEGKALIDLPDYYRFLNEDDMIWVNPVNHFGSGYGSLDLDKKTLTVTTNEDGKYNVLLIATRKDKSAKAGWAGPEVPSGRSKHAAAKEERDIVRAKGLKELEDAKAKFLALKKLKEKDKNV